MGYSKTFEIENTCQSSPCNDEDILILNLSWVPNLFRISAVRAELVKSSNFTNPVFLLRHNL